MSAHHLNDVLVFLIAAVVVVSVFRWLKISPILGYLLAGAVIGPYALAFIADVEGAKMLGEFGVVFLLFSIGLKLPIQRLQMLKRYVFGLGVAQVTVCAIFIGFIAYYFGQSLEASMLIGSALALSSTAVGVQILTERGELAARFGRMSFSILLLQDLAVVILLVLLSNIGQPDTPIIKELGFALMKAGTVLAIIIAVGRIILRPVYKSIASLASPELFVAMTLLVVLITSVTTNSAGLSMELGAFLAGLLLSETEYRHQVVADIEPFNGLLLGLFFMSVGMMMDMGLLVSHAWPVFCIVFGLISSKLVFITGLASLFNLSWPSALRCGLLLAAGGEFVFVVIGPAVENAIISSLVGQLLFLSVAISMALTPILDMLGKQIEEKFKEKEYQSSIESAFGEVGDLRDHVIIAGYGRVGRRIADLLTDKMTPYVAIDKNMDKVNEGRVAGLPVFYGDAKRPHVMRAIGGDKAKVVVICINSASQAQKAALMVKKNFPNASICVRLQDDEYEAKLKSLGINVIVPEMIEPTLQIAAVVLESLGTQGDEINKSVEDFRKELLGEKQDIDEKVVSAV